MSDSAASNILGFKPKTASSKSTDKLKAHALEGLGAMVMLTDAQDKIVYLNAAMSSFLSHHPSVLGSLNIQNIIGQNISHISAELTLHRGQNNITLVASGMTLSLTSSPIMDDKGRPSGLSIVWTDQTDALENEALVNAINTSQAVIHFDMDGTIRDANENFLSVMGYNLSEIKGKHHSMFAPADFAASQEYKDFWKTLNKGEYQAAQYMRLGKGGKEIWIEASYNPIFDANGKPYKVVKFATDLTPRKEENIRLANDFETNVQSLVQTVASSSNEMRSTAQNLAAAAEETSTQSNTVAAATEELSASVNEISEQVTSSVKIVGDAVGEAQQAEQHVSSLVEAAERIGKIIELISDIADQTNLLALNATIEAARAGDAGKGFAVVASEVKALAAETAKSAEEISTQISGIQNVSASTADSIKKITDVIARVNEISTTISTAVEEQSAATQEVASNISGVQTAADETGQSSNIVLNVAQDLTERSDELQQRVDEFLTQVRSM